jgi:hypothetical protein
MLEQFRAVVLVDDVGPNAPWQVARPLRRADACRSWPGHPGTLGSVRWPIVTGAIDVADAFQSQSVKRLYVDLGQSCSSRRR